jgi:hypothetical protein
MQKASGVIQPSVRHVQTAPINVLTIIGNLSKLPAIFPHVGHGHKIRPLKAKDHKRSFAKKQLLTARKKYQPLIFEIDN